MSVSRLTTCSFLHLSPQSGPRNTFRFSNVTTLTSFFLAPGLVFTDIHNLLNLCAHFQSHHWKAVLLGQAVCEEREQWSVHTAKTLCQRLLQDTHSALDQVCVPAHTHTHSTKLLPLIQHNILIIFFLMCCVFRSPSSCSSVSSRSGSSSMWSSHCDRRRGASWEKVWMYWKTCWDNQMNCCHANLMLTP